MKQKNIDLIHEVRMSIVQIGIPATIGIVWGIESGFFDRMNYRIKMKIAEIKAKKK